MFLLDFVQVENFIVVKLLFEEIYQIIMGFGGFFIEVFVYLFNQFSVEN